MEVAMIQNFIDAHPFAAGGLFIWSLVWKGLALWQAAGRRERYWFIALLVINTLGLLEIVYLFFIVPSKTRAAVNPPKRQTESSNQ